MKIRDVKGNEPTPDFFFEDKGLLINKIPMEDHNLEKLDNLFFKDNFCDYDMAKIYDLLDNFNNREGDIWEFYLKIALSQK